MIDDKRFNDLIDRSMVGVEWEIKFETFKWVEKIPYIPFKNGWKVKIIPPFGGAIVRFLVSKSGDNNKVSVYLDCYGMLGGFDDVPYWEVYPYNGDAFRCKMLEVDKLIEAIEISLKELSNDGDSKS